MCVVYRTTAKLVVAIGPAVEVTVTSGRILVHSVSTRGVRSVTSAGGSWPYPAMAANSSVINNV